MVNSVSIPNPYQGSTLIHLNQLPATAPQNHPAISRNGRRRGVVLTQQGWQKMMQAGVLYDDFGKRYTFEELSERSLLDARTVSRILSCEVKVDKRTLKTFFQAFNLQLETGDYTVPGFRVEERTIDSPTQISLASKPFRPSVEEIIQLKQMISEHYGQVFELLGLDKLLNEIRELSELSSQDLERI